MAVPNNLSQDQIDALSYALQLSGTTNMTPFTDNYVWSTRTYSPSLWPRDEVSIQPMSPPSRNIYTPWIPMITPKLEDNWYEDLLESRMSGLERVAKDPKDFEVMLQFYWNKFIREDIQRMVVYCPRRCGKTQFLINQFMKEDGKRISFGCHSVRSFKDIIERIQDEYRLILSQTIKGRIFNASDAFNPTWKGYQTDIFIIDEYLPNIKNILDKRCFILTTPNYWNKFPYSVDEIEMVDIFRDYPKDIDEYNSFSRRFKLPDELFELQEE